MKLRKFAWVLVLAMLVAGCGKEEEKEPSNTGSNIEINTGKDNTEKEENSGTVENNEPVENQDSTDTPTVGVYDVFIAYVRDMIVNEPIKMLDVQGLSGIGDAIMSSSTMVTGDENLAKFGYHIADINGDSIPEIMLGRTDDTKMIYSLYTLVNGEPTLKFEGYYKNMYNYLGDGRFFYNVDNFDMIINRINNIERFDLSKLDGIVEEFDDLNNGVWDSVNSIYTYKNSAMGVIENLSADYSSLDFDAAEIQKKLGDGENVEFLKEVLTKLG